MAASYPGEFASGALPGAINLPIRPTPTDILKQRISQLPKDKPIIVPCYDRTPLIEASMIPPAA